MNKAHDTVQLWKLTFTIIHSTTILLLAWNSTLKDFKLPECLMPHDVPMGWKSTFDMLEFVLVYQKVISASPLPQAHILQECTMGGRMDGHGI